MRSKRIRWSLATIRAPVLAIALALSLGLAQPELPPYQAFLLSTVSRHFAFEARLIRLEPLDGTTTHLETIDRHGGGFVEKWETTFRFEQMGGLDSDGLERGLEAIHLQFPQWIVFGNNPWQYADDGRLMREVTFNDLSVTQTEAGPIMGADLGRVVTVRVFVDSATEAVALAINWSNDVPE